MDDIKASIKAYVLVRDATLEDDDYLDEVIAEVVDRTLAYTNRQQLVNYYERNKDLIQDGYDHPYIEVPIPPELERPIATLVVNAYRTYTAQKTATTGGIKSINDGKQSVTYGDNIVSYLATKDDTEVFTGMVSLLDNFRLPTVVVNT